MSELAIRVRLRRLGRARVVDRVVVACRSDSGRDIGANILRFQWATFWEMKWTNWAGNQTATPAAFVKPRGKDELSAIVRRAAAMSRRVKVVGAGHSFTDIAATDGVLISLDNHNRVLDVDRQSKRVTVEAGIRLFDLCPALATLGLAMSNLGDITEQSVAGAISTSTHGTGLGFQSIAASVVGLELIDGAGNLVSCSDTEDVDLWRVARVGLGALGIIATVTIQCVDAFALHAIEDNEPLADVLATFDRRAAENDHFEFFWLPYTKRAFTKHNERLAELPPPRTRAEQARHAVAKDMVENVGLGAAIKLGKARPDLVPRLSNAMAKRFSRREYTLPSHEVFATKRRVRFTEMEYALPVEHFANAFGELLELIDRLGTPISLPIEVRVLGGDDIALSTATDRESVYIAIHMAKGVAFDAYFAGAEDIFSRHDGRPHWGKLHFQKASTLAPLYPQWDAFQAARSRMDPEGRFTNAYLERVLGPVR